MAIVKMDQAAVDELLHGKDGPLAQHLERLGILAETQAKRLCPVDTGRLRSSITHTLQEDSDGLAVYVGTDVEYAIYVEMGTATQVAQPFLRPAATWAVAQDAG